MFEVSINNKRSYVVSMCHSPSQTYDYFNSFTTNLEKLVVNVFSSILHFMLIIEDFNDKSSNQSSTNTATAEGALLEYLTSIYHMKQAITEPKHILENSSSCINLIFCNQANLTTDSGVSPILQ